MHFDRLTNDIQDITRTIVFKYRQSSARESLLIAVSGIDGSGKGFITGRLVKRLRQQGLNAVSINIDGWLNLPHRRFGQDRPAEHFYRHAIRFEEMFEQLVLPLKRNRSVHVETDFAEETAREYRKHRYDFHDVDVIFLEGIFLLKPDFLPSYDWKLWIDCSFETALERALQRGQESLPPEETIQAYQRIYFPAQELHLCRDEPRTVADAILVNDPRLEQQELRGGRLHGDEFLPAGK